MFIKNLRRAMYNICFQLLVMPFKKKKRKKKKVKMILNTNNSWAKVQSCELTTQACPLWIPISWGDEPAHKTPEFCLEREGPIGFGFTTVQILYLEGPNWLKLNKVKKGKNKKIKKDARRIIYELVHRSRLKI